MKEFVEHLRTLGVPAHVGWRSDAVVPVALVGWYAPRAAWQDSATGSWRHGEPMLPSALVAFLLTSCEGDGFASGYLRVARDQDSPQESEAGEIHLTDIDLAHVVPLAGVTFEDACGTWELTNREFDQWLTSHTRREK